MTEPHRKTNTEFKRDWMRRHRELVSAQNRVRWAEQAGKEVDAETLNIIAEWKEEKRRRLAEAAKVRKAKARALERKRRGRSPRTWANMIKKLVDPEYQLWVACVIFFREAGKQCGTYHSWTWYRENMMAGPVPEHLSEHRMVDEVNKLGLHIKLVDENRNARLAALPKRGKRGGKR